MYQFAGAACARGEGSVALALTADFSWPMLEFKVMPSLAESISIWELWRVGQLRNVMTRRRGAVVVSIVEEEGGA